MKFQYKILKSFDGDYFGHARTKLHNGLQITIGTNLFRTKKWKQKELRAAIKDAVAKRVK